MTTRFTEAYMEASRHFTLALETPTEDEFRLAHGASIRAIGASYTGTNPHQDLVEWDTAQRLSESIKKAAFACGYRI